MFKDPKVVSSLDRNQITNRKAVGFASSLLKSAGADLLDFNLSTNTLRRNRDSGREILAKQAIEQFKVNQPEHLVLHWDSKLIDDAHGTKKERLAILVSGSPSYIEGKLLGVPSLEDENGNATSTGLRQFQGASEYVKLLSSLPLFNRNRSKLGNLHSLRSNLPPS